MALDTDLKVYYKMDAISGGLVADEKSFRDLNILGDQIIILEELGILENCIFWSGMSPETAFAYMSSAPLDLDNDFSFSIWLNHQVTDTFQTILGVKAGNDFDTNFGLWVALDENNKITIASNNGTTNNMISTSADCPYNEWVHIVITKTGTTGNIYINGSKTTGTIWETGLNGEYWSIGNNFQGNSHFRGGIDEFGLWSREISQEEVTELYNSGNGLAYPFSEPVAEFSFNNSIFRFGSRRMSKRKVRYTENTINYTIYKTIEIQYTD